MKINPFLAASCILNILSAIWYFYNGGIKMGLLFSTYSVSSVILLWLGVQ
jgi:hypothetical protein